jgi:hypothetical protein
LIFACPDFSGLPAFNHWSSSLCHSLVQLILYSAFIEAKITHAFTKSSITIGKKNDVKDFKIPELCKFES